MSIGIAASPAEFQPVLSDGIYFTFSSATYDVSTTFKFRYKYQLFVDDTFVFEGKCSPNPFGLGIADLQQVLESYTTSLPLSYWDTTPIYTHQTFPFSRPLNLETINYYLKVGYEYADSETSPITGFTGIGTVVGNPTYQTEILKVFRSTMGTNGRATQQDFNISPFVLSGTPLSIYPTTSGLFLTNAPRIMDVTEEDYFVLAFTNYYLNSGSTPTILSEPYYVQYNFFDGDGQSLGSVQFDNIVSNGGGPRTSGCDVYPALYNVFPWSSTTYNTLYVGAGPANIPMLPPNTAQYTVQLFGVFEGATTPIEASPTPTPTNTSTPVTTLTPTPTPSPACGSCREYTIEYTGLSEFGTAYFTNCITGAAQNFKPLPTVIYVVCSCNVPTGLDLDVIDIGSCIVTPTPTPSPTSTPAGATPTQTPTPTITPDCYKSWNITDCAGACSGGICACEGGSSITVYTNCYVTNLTDPFTEIFDNAGLTNPYTGDFSSGGSIYNSSGSGVTLVCNIGGPC
jgi:hypothetical protein